MVADPAMDGPTQAAAEGARGFMPPDEGLALYRAGLNLVAPVIHPDEATDASLGRSPDGGATP